MAAPATINMLAPNGVVASGNVLWPDGSSSPVSATGIVAVPTQFQSYALNAGFSEEPGGVGATLTLSATNPTNTASTTSVMMGFGAQATPATITPKGTSRVNVSIMGQMAQATSGDGAQIDCRWGTSAAPANGAAASGTVVGQAQAFTAVAANHGGGFSIGGIITGLTPGVPIWIDCSLKTITGGTASLTGITVEAFEF